MQSKKTTMQFETFQQSIKNAVPPANLSVYLVAMWYDAHGDWDTAHHMIGDLEDSTACWVHAYLHRKEGDVGNANYWYSKANKKMPAVNLQQEWEIIVQTLL
jgi:hypothetical protein